MILLLLKERTKPYHDSIDSSMNIFQQYISLDDYRHILECFWGFYVPVEMQLKAMSERLLLVDDFEQRYKLPMLANDLSALGVNAARRQSLPLCNDIPLLNTVPQVLGCMYVLEGATLGGQIITRRLQQVVGVDATRDCTFFYSYGREVGAMWQKFCHVLTDYASHPAIEEAIISAACETFEKFNRWFGERKETCLNSYSYKQSI